MATPEWISLKAAAGRAIDEYVAEQRQKFGRVEFVPVNAILDRVAVSKGQQKNARAIISLTLKERGWKRGQSGASRAATKMWVREEVQA